jgi:hypothetical protein
MNLIPSADLVPSARGTPGAIQKFCDLQQSIGVAALLKLDPTSNSILKQTWRRVLRTAADTYIQPMDERRQELELARLILKFGCATHPWTQDNRNRRLLRCC